MRIFLAGATGVIGRRLVPILVTAGHEVTGMTRTDARAAAIRAQGGHAVVCDAFDRDRLAEAVASARPDVVIHQLTDLGVPDPSRIDVALLERNARLREIGTSNLVAAAAAADARRVVAQSVAWLYAAGPEPHHEDDDLVLLSPSSVTERGVLSLERQVMGDPRFDGVVLRYGRLYGPDTWADVPPEPPTVHVEAAALAAALAVDRGAVGAYNIVDDGGPAANDRAREQLGWDPGWRMG